MSSHADTIRAQGRCPGCGWRNGDGSLCASCYRVAALLADNQQLRRERDAAHALAQPTSGTSVMLRAENQQLRKALERIAAIIEEADTALPRRDILAIALAAVGEE